MFCMEQIVVFVVNGVGILDCFFFYWSFCCLDYLGKWQSESIVCQCKIVKCGGFYQIFMVDFSFYECFCGMDFYYYLFIVF